MPESFDDLGWALLPAAMGVGLVLIFASFSLTAWRRHRTWTRTDATVGKVRVRDASASGTGGGIFANYHYTDRTGEKHMGVHSPMFRKPKRKSTLQVRYDPDNPGLSEVAMPLWAEWAIAAGGIAVGVALAWFSLSGGFDS